jgi:uncharacterized protein YndB with AHSA1/START domain
MDEARIEISAPPRLVYDLIADIPAMGRWSPETYRAEWVDGASAAVVGARFRGWNRAVLLGVPATWRTTAVIRRADPGRALSFDVPFSGARWTYRFTPSFDGTACTVVEAREILRTPLPSRLLDRVIGQRRQHQLAAGMRITLERLKHAAEAEAGRTPPTPAAPDATER